MNTEEKQYIDLIKKIIGQGVEREHKNQVTRSIFGEQLRFSLTDNKFPLITTKHVCYRLIIEELLWMIRGSTKVSDLHEKDVHIWDLNGSRKFLDSVGLTKRETGDLGPIYGFQWRSFGSKYLTSKDDYTGKGVDQLAQVIEQLKTDPYSRRIIMTAWNPLDLPQMALPPCHILAQFYVSNNTLSTHLYQRSADVGLGLPFNISSYSLLTIILGHITGLTPHTLIMSLGDAHIYTPHIKNLEIQCTRSPFPFPTIHIKREIKKIEDFSFEDFQIQNYKRHDPLFLELLA